jgi:spectinomycin phosphotransferase
MLEKPNISDNLNISRLKEEYNLHVAELTFLPLGADMGTAVYRVTTVDGTAYFLKLRRGFEEITVTVPIFLKSQGIQEIIAPIETKSKRGWADFGDYRMILYPFIKGKDGFERELSDHHRKALGSALKRIHSTQLPPDLKSLIPQENFSPPWRKNLGSFQEQVENQIYDDHTAAKLAGFMKSRRGVITRLIERAEKLASELQSQPLDFVLCHTDIHGGNILIGRDGQLPVPTNHLYIVDWDNPLLAPKERDLMFIGGGIDGIWKSERDIAVFYEGYGQTEVNLSALSYYRYERVVEDLAVIAEQLLLTDQGGEDRERSYGWFTSNFEPGQTIEIADKTVDLLKTGH